MFPLPFVDLPGPLLVGPIFLLLLWLGFKSPLRAFTTPLVPRVVRNFLFALPGLLLFRLTLIPIPYFAAQWAQKQDFGLLNWLPIPFWLAAIVGFLSFDYA